MAQKKKRPTAKERRNGLIINVLTLIVLILLVFEGKSLISLFSSQTIQDRIRQEESEVFAGANLTEKQTEAATEVSTQNSTEKGSENLTEQETESETDAPVTDRFTGLPDGGEEYMDVLADGAWEKVFTEKPEVLTREEKRAWLDQMDGVTLGSDAFFPFSDNIERAHKSGVKYIAQPGGSVRDDLVIECCNKYQMIMAFTGIRLFHH